MSKSSYMISELKNEYNRMLTGYYQIKGADYIDRPNFEDTEELPKKRATKEELEKIETKRDRARLEATELTKIMEEISNSFHKLNYICSELSPFDRISIMKYYKNSHKLRAYAYAEYAIRFYNNPSLEGMIRGILDDANFDMRVRYDEIAYKVSTIAQTYASISRVELTEGCKFFI